MPGAGIGVRHTLQSAAVTTMMPPSIPVLQNICSVINERLRADAGAFGVLNPVGDQIRIFSGPRGLAPGLGARQPSGFSGFSATGFRYFLLCHSARASYRTEIQLPRRGKICRVIQPGSEVRFQSCGSPNPCAHSALTSNPPGAASCGGSVSRATKSAARANARLGPRDRGGFGCRSPRFSLPKNPWADCFSPRCPRAAFVSNA